MKKTLLVHVGLAKTGTTWLQQMVFPNVPNYVYLGKDPFISRLFAKTHYELFQSFNLQFPVVLPRGGLIVCEWTE